MQTVTPTVITIPAIKGSNLRLEVEIPDGIQILEGPLPEGHFCFRIMDPKKGDERLTWNADDFFQIKAAKKLFVDLIKKGLKPFHVGVGGKATSEAMSEFDPSAEEVIFLPQSLVVGG